MAHDPSHRGARLFTACKALGGRGVRMEEEEEEEEVSPLALSQRGLPAPSSYPVLGATRSRRSAPTCPAVPFLFHLQAVLNNRALARTSGLFIRARAASFMAWPC